MVYIQEGGVQTITSNNITLYTRMRVFKHLQLDFSTSDIHLIMSAQYALCSIHRRKKLTTFKMGNFSAKTKLHLLVCKSNTKELMELSLHDRQLIVINQFKHIHGVQLNTWEKKTITFIGDTSTGTFDDDNTNGFS